MPVGRRYEHGHGAVARWTEAGEVGVVEILRRLRAVEAHAMARFVFHPGDTDAAGHQAGEQDDESRSDAAIRFHRFIGDRGGLESGPGFLFKMSNGPGGQRSRW